MKLLLLVSLFFAQINLYANDCDENDLQKLAKSYSIPNCFTTDKLELTKMYADDPESICGECRNKFETISNIKINPPSKKTIQEDFLEATVQEYRKNIIDNLFIATKLRALPSVGSDLSKAINACRMKTDDDFAKNCQSKAAIDMLKDKKLFNNLSNSIARELAKIISTEDEPINNTLLDRNIKNSCFIPEKDVLLFSNLVIEDSFTPDLIQAISNVNTKSLESVSQIFDLPEFHNLVKDKISFKNAIQNHPQLSLVDSPEKFVALFKSVKSPFSTQDLRASLASDTTTKEINNSIAKRCENAFNEFKAALCSPKFNNGNIDTDPFNNFDRITTSEIAPTESELATTEELIQNNARVLQLCEVSPGKDKLNLSATQTKISANLDPTFVPMTLKDYKLQKFDSELGLKTKYICENKSGNCDIEIFNCRIAQKYLESKNKDSLEAKLAGSSNKEVNALLRSMIGDTSALDPKTKDILVLNGILPKEDGTMVAQPEIPERQPNYFANNRPASSSAQAKPSTTTTVAQTSQVSQGSQGSSQAFNSNIAPSTSSMPDFSDLLDGPDQELRNVQNEIMRRLSNFDGNRPPTKEAAKKIARDSFRAKGRSITPQQEEAFASRMMQAPSRVGESFGNDFFDDKTSRNEVASSNTESEAQKFKRDGMNRALADMQGARAAAGAMAGRGPASEASTDDSKTLTSVALNITEDPKVSLSQIFSEKLNKNDPETQLLKVLVSSKKNFILQVRGVNFKVVFDENQKMNLLLESGDKEEAQKLRPQLEIFFKRLKLA